MNPSAIVRTLGMIIVSNLLFAACDSGGDRGRASVPPPQGRIWMMNGDQLYVALKQYADDNSGEWPEALTEDMNWVMEGYTRQGITIKGWKYEKPSDTDVDPIVLRAMVGSDELVFVRRSGATGRIQFLEGNRMIE